MPITDQPLTPGTVWQVCPVHPTTPLRFFHLDNGHTWPVCPPCSMDEWAQDACALTIQRKPKESV